MQPARRTRRVFLVIVLGAAGWVAYRAREPIDVNTWNLRYGELPQDDQALQDWLKSQPGVIRASVIREGNQIAVNYTQSQGQPNIRRDLLEKAKELGYGKFGGISGGLTPGTLGWRGALGFD